MIKEEPQVDNFPELINDFFSYENKQDITSTYPNILQSGSQNMFIVKVEDSKRPSKLVTRAGMKKLGQASTVNVGIRSEFDKLYDKQGNLLLIREYPGLIQDQIEVLLGNTWTDLTKNPSDLPVGLHTYDFEKWWDVKNNQQRLIIVNGSNKVMSWSGGYAAVVTVGSNFLTLAPGDTWEKHGFIVDSPNFLVFAGTSFTVTGGWTTDTLTLTTNPVGVINPGDIVTQGIRQDSLLGQDSAVITNFNLDTVSNYINHVVYCDKTNATTYFSQYQDHDDFVLTLSGITGTFQIHETVTGGSSGATGIVQAFNSPNLDVTNTTGTFQIGETITGSVSGATGTIASMLYKGFGETTFAGSGLNNGFFTGIYTGTNQTANYQVTIDGVFPAINEQGFEGTGVNDITFDTSGYNGTGTNEYKVVCVANAAFTFVGTPTITPAPGEILVGATSKAIAQVQFLDSGGQDPVLKMLTSEGFIVGEVVTGPREIAGNHTYGTIFSVVPFNWFQFYKDIGGNWTSFTPTGYTPFFAYVVTSTPVPLGVDGLSLNVPNVFTAHNVGDFWTLKIDSGSPDTFSWFLDGVAQANSVPISAANTPILLSQGVYIQFTTTTGHVIGDTWVVIILRTVTDAWRDASFSQPIRLPGEGRIVLLDAPPIDQVPQEDGIYFNTLSGSWIRVSFDITANQDETVTIQKLKSQYQNKMLLTGLINYDLNSIIYITANKTVLSLGRVQFLEEPQHQLLSDVVKFDFLNTDFTDGDISLWDNFMCFTAPKAGVMFVYDLALRIWQPPQVFADPIAKLSNRGNDLVGHSYTKNQTYTLFKGTNDDGSPFVTRVRLPYNTYGAREDQKAYSMTWAEGYISGAPRIIFTVNRGLAGCQGSESHDIKPIMCIPPSTASLGSGSLGLHSLGSDNIQIPPKFREIYKVQNTSSFREANMELECSTLDQDWQLLSIGINVVDSASNNQDLVSN